MRPLKQNQLFHHGLNRLHGHDHSHNRSCNHKRSNLSLLHHHNLKKANPNLLNPLNHLNRLPNLGSRTNSHTMSNIRPILSTNHSDHSHSLRLRPKLSLKLSLNHYVVAQFALLSSLKALHS